MQFPAPVMCTVSPVIVQFPDTIEKLTASPDVAVALDLEVGVAERVVTDVERDGLVGLLDVEGAVDVRRGVVVRVARLRGRHRARARPGDGDRGARHRANRR